MITTVNKEGVTIITPDKDMWLVKDGIYSGGDVYLSKLDKAENWLETATKPPDPVRLLPEERLAAAEAELDRYKLAVADIAKINTATALKADLVAAMTKLTDAVKPVAAEVKP